jgi:CHAT domain-containing protein/tetratricopeptide (TPR) repeat protein
LAQDAARQPAQQWARQLIAPDSAGLDADSSPRAIDEWIALAWALKDECQVAWTEEPPRTQRCAAVLEALRRRATHAEIDAAAAWCGGLSLLAQGQMEAAMARLDEAHAALQALGQTQRAAQSLIPKVIALSMLGRHDDMLACGRETLALLIAANDPVSAGKVEGNLGWALLRRDRYAESADCFRRAATRFSRAGDATHSIMADIGLASALTWQGDFAEALRMYDRCAMRVSARGLISLQAVIDTHRGRLELHRGRLEPALRALEAALRQAEVEGVPQDLAETRGDLADAYLALNLLPEAVALYEQTIESCREFDTPVERAWAEVQRAQAMVRLGEVRRAARGLDDAHALFVADDNSVAVALTDLRRAALELQLGDASAALPRAETASAALREAGVESWHWEAELTVTDALAALGQWKTAHNRCQQTLNATQELPELRAACHTRLGELLLRQGDAEAARTQFEQAVEQGEVQRASLPDDEFRTAYGADKQRPYDALIELAVDQHGSSASWQVLRAIERARAPALRTTLERGESSTGMDTGRREQLHWLQGQWQQSITDGDLLRARQLQARMRALEQAWLEQYRRSKAAAGATPSARPSDALGAFEGANALCAAMPSNTAMVIFALVGERLVACVATRESLVHVTAPAAGLIERIEQLRFQIDALRFGAPALRRHAAQMAQRCQGQLQALHALIWQPLAHAVQACQRVVVVPHRVLHYVPFAALHDGVAPLLDRHEISLAPSVSLWLNGRAATAAEPPVAWRRVVALGIGGDTLPHVEAEVRAVAQAFTSQPGGSATVCLDLRATQPALREALAGADVLHLACHGQFRADSPYFSALHLGDGLLTVRDAATLPLKAQLVTLSACETGMSKIAPGDELLGLLRGFLMAGAPRVLSTHWTVDDASTATLMAQFYRGVLGGARPAAALRAAQQALAREQPHPYHWAAFALHERG